jgi:hypothetical protein
VLSRFLTCAECIECERVEFSREFDRDTANDGGNVVDSVSAADACEPRLCADHTFAT